MTAAERAIALVSQFNPQQVYVYAMGQEPWLTYITSIHYTEESRPILESNKLVQACRNRNIFSERLLGKKEIVLDDNSRGLPTVAFPKNYSEPLSENKVTQTIDEFLAKLSHLDIKLWVDGERLRCNAPKGILTPTLKTQLSEHKAEILEFLNNKSNDSKNLALLKADAVLNSSIRPELLTKTTVEPSCIFLTGATGFIGAFLLYELLQQTSADVYCLVRANSTELAWNKLQNCLKSYLLWEESFRIRIIPVIGDLSQPLLSISEEQFHQLADKIDVIYHNGAWVHHASPYSLLKATNVLGTQEVLRLACKFKAKPVHFISASSVFPEVGDSGVRVIREQDNIDNGKVPFDGYSQSKWVAEKLVTAAGNRGLPVCIYRLGRISGHSKTGVFNVNDFFYRLIIGCVQLGSIPDGELIQDIIPIDYTTKAIVHLSKQQESWGKAFHLVHPQPVSSNLFFDKLRSLGYPIQNVSYEQWYNQLLNIAESSPKHALYPLVSLLPAPNSQIQSSESAVLKFDYQNTIDGLKGTSITCPPIDDQLLNTYFSYLINSAFLAPPPISNELKKAV